MLIAPNSNTVVDPKVKMTGVSPSTGNVTARRTAKMATMNRLLVRNESAKLDNSNAKITIAL